eukprot:Tbor_TRINITY_DN4424_c0_g1::TRINITY_DN4424_c0_g1_i2::g.7911::m.7911
MTMRSSPMRMVITDPKGKEDKVCRESDLFTKSIHLTRNLSSTAGANGRHTRPNVNPREYTANVPVSACSRGLPFTDQPTQQPQGSPRGVMRSVSRVESNKAPIAERMGAIQRCIGTVSSGVIAGGLNIDDRNNCSLSSTYSKTSFYKGKPAADRHRSPISVKSAASAAPGPMNSSYATRSSIGSVNNTQILASQESRVVQLVDGLAALEQQLSNEVTIREKTVASLMEAFQKKIREAVDAIENKNRQKLTEMQISVNNMADKIVCLERELAVERGKNERLTQELLIQEAGGGDFEELSEHFYKEKERSQKSYSELESRVSQEIQKINSSIEEERIMRDKECSVVKELLQEVSSTRQNADNKLLAKFYEDLHRIKKAVENEKVEREVTEENIAATLEDIVNSLKQ